MSDRKCKVCGDNAEWEFDGECYCEFCVRTELDVHGNCTPRICEMCGDPLDRVYYTDSEDNAFCSPKCALEYNGAALVEDNDEEVQILPDDL